MAPCPPLPPGPKPAQSDHWVHQRGGTVPRPTRAHVARPTVAHATRLGRGTGRPVASVLRFALGFSGSSLSGRFALLHSPFPVPRIVTDSSLYPVSPSPSPLPPPLPPPPLSRIMPLACANCGRTHISTVGAVVDGRNVFCNVDCAWSYRFRLAAAVSSARAVAAVEETTAAAAAVVAAATAAASSRRRRHGGGGRKSEAAGGGATDAVGRSTPDGLSRMAGAHRDSPTEEGRRRGRRSRSGVVAPPPAPYSECVVHSAATCGRHYMD